MAMLSVAAFALSHCDSRISKFGTLSMIRSVKSPRTEGFIFFSMAFAFPVATLEDL